MLCGPCERARGEAVAAVIRAAEAAAATRIRDLVLEVIDGTDLGSLAEVMLAHKLFFTFPVVDLAACRAAWKRVVDAELIRPTHQILRAEGRPTPLLRRRTNDHGLWSEAVDSRIDAWIAPAVGVDRVPDKGWTSFDAVIDRTGRIWQIPWFVSRADFSGERFLSRPSFDIEDRTTERLIAPVGTPFEAIATRVPAHKWGPASYTVHAGVWSVEAHDIEFGDRVHTCRHENLEADQIRGIESWLAAGYISAVGTIFKDQSSKSA